MARAVLLDRSTGRPVVDRSLRELLEARERGDIAELIERSRLSPDLVGLESNPPLFMDVSSAYSGDELGLPYRDLISEGIVGATDLAVTGHAAANSIDIAKGSCWVLGDTNADRQPNYRCFNDAIVNLGINPDPSNPRYIRVVAQVTDQAFAGSGRLWALSAIHGTPAGSPTVPAEPASAITLASVLVPAAAASSAAYTFTDLRARATVGAGQAAIGTYAWTSYTPAWTSSGTAPALGNGSLVGRYVQIGKLTVFSIALVMGSTTTYGTGVYSLSLPVTANTGVGGVLGGTLVSDASPAQAFIGQSQLVSGTTISMYTSAAPAVLFGPTVPITFASGDIIYVRGMYEAA